MKSGKKITMIMIAFLIICIIAFSVPLIFQHASPSHTTDTWSRSFSDKDEKLAFLAEYLTAPSEIMDAEYHIDYHDNSTGRVPGPSDWDIRVALKIKQEDIPLWMEGFAEIPADEINLAWWNGLETENIYWDDGDYICYKRPESISYLVVFPDTGIILKAVSSMYYT